MTLLVVFVAFLIIAVAVDGLVERKRRKPIAECDGEDWGTGADEGLATPCRKPLSARSVHRVAHIEEISDEGIQGYSASLGMFCGKHCPGDCSNPHCRLTRV